MDLTQLLRARLRREPCKYSVPGSLPVLFFGHLARARVQSLAGLREADQ